MNSIFKLFVLCILGTFMKLNAQQFVKTKGHQFFLKGKPYYFIGTNFWYASYLGLEKNPQRGIERLRKELDFLQSQNVNNIRVLVGVEGSGKINGVNRVEPAYQYEAGKFNDENLKGLDILMKEISKRNMKVVLFLSNNWEWSGGFLQYLNWNGQIDDTTLQRVLNWDELRDYTLKFYTCQPCIQQYREQVKKIITRKNSVTGKQYTKDKSIMAWEIANEPRPMRPSANESYKKFIAETAAFIKSLDKNHLVTTGSEGEQGTENRDLYIENHLDINIDYLTIHIWPKNWGWFEKEKMEEGFENAKSKSLEYISSHIKIADSLKKPIVLEEFGFPRDRHSFDVNTSVSLRNQYYDALFQLWKNNKQRKGSFAGIAFWAFGGTARPIPGQVYWKKGDDFMGDPPMEEQGLNAVFDSDSSTWEVISKYAK
ncbi:cellulase family glycosylhydrolase [Chryseobacterium sp.]|uniref:glycoside hydrolase 5 family protein n=1 Tax=Chryseobacterium sp. TaxID=1871047 RepID=UPI0025C4099D|nr:cellulase family glycosylhydrolase [Chryseobacterium sp.]